MKQQQKDKPTYKQTHTGKRKRRLKEKPKHRKTDPQSTNVTNSHLIIIINNNSYNLKIQY